MESISGQLALVGFGEAGRTFAQSASGLSYWRDFTAYDRFLSDPKFQDVKAHEIINAGGLALPTTQEAVSKAQVVASLVTASQALIAAHEVCQHIRPDVLYLDFNSVAPSTKQSAALAIQQAGGRYVDVAVMSPVLPARLKAPLLLSGPHAELGRTTLQNMGFENVRIAGERIGQASSIKMIRSVMIKGIEALTSECMLAAHKAGVADQVLASLDASQTNAPWQERADYNLDRMMIHGRRRAEEMLEVVQTLNDLGIDSAMSQGTAKHQKRIGDFELNPPPEGLHQKLQLITQQLTGK